MCSMNLYPEKKTKHETAELILCDGICASCIIYSKLVLRMEMLPGKLHSKTKRISVIHMMFLATLKVCAIIVAMQYRLLRQSPMC